MRHEGCYGASGSERKDQGWYGYLPTVYRQAAIAPVVAGDCRVRLGRERLRDVTRDAQGLAGRELAIGAVVGLAAGWLGPNG